jgi:hypothetical protein
MKKHLVLLALAASVVLPVSASAATPKQIFRAKVAVAAKTYASRHGWHVTDITATAFTMSFPGEAPSGNGAAVVGMEGGSTIAAVTYSADLTKVGGVWRVTHLKVTGKSQVN